MASPSAPSPSSMPRSETLGGAMARPPLSITSVAAAAPFHKSLRRSRSESPSSGTTPSPSRASRPAWTWSMISAGPGARRTRLPLGATTVSGTWQARASAACSTMWRTSPWTGRAICGRIHW
jgi:hypothetical protein